MENLQGTKLALSRLVRLKAPRNFTLTPDMVPVRTSSRQPLQMGLRLASALAAILLVVLFGAEFILGQIPQPAMLAAEAPAMEAARADDEAEPEPLIQWGPPAAGGKGGGVGGNSAAMEEPMLEMEALPADEASPEMEAPVEEPPLAESQPESQPEIQAEQEEAAEMLSENGDLILGINPDQGGEIIASSAPADASSENIPLPWPAVLHWMQIALAVIAVGGGLALLVLRLSRRTK